MIKVDSLCVVDVEESVHQCELPRRRAHWVLEDELTTLCGWFQLQEHCKGEMLNCHIELCLYLCRLSLVSRKVLKYAESRARR